MQMTVICINGWGAERECRRSLTCSSHCCIYYNCPTLSGLLDIQRRRKTPECLHHAIPAENEIKIQNKMYCMNLTWTFLYEIHKFTVDIQF